MIYRALVRIARVFKRVSAIIISHICTGWYTGNVRCYLRTKGVVALREHDLRADGKVMLNLADSAHLTIGQSVRLARCTIAIGEHATVTLEDSVDIADVDIRVAAHASLLLRKGVRIHSILPDKAALFISEYGSVMIGEESSIRALLSVGSQGQLRVGCRTMINQGTEIRCSQSVQIGDYTLISYQVNIFDTNTHSTNWEDRHRALASSPPYQLTNEVAPITRPIIIGNDCWVGKCANILKGVTIGDRAIVAMGAVVTHSVPEEHVAYGNPAKSKPIILSRGQNTPQEQALTPTNDPVC